MRHITTGRIITLILVSVLMLGAVSAVRSHAANANGLDSESSTTALDAEVMTVRPQQLDSYLTNPGIGWQHVPGIGEQLLPGNRR